MEGMTYKEFYDHIYYGGEIEFTYNNNCYFIEGFWKETKVHTISVWHYDTFGAESKYREEIYNVTNSDGSENLNNFLNTKIFEGKSFLDAEPDIIVEEIW